MSKREILNSPGVVKISGLDQRNQRFWQTTALSQVTRNKIRVHAVPGCCRVGDVLTVSYDKKTAEYRVVSITDDDDVELILVTDAECIFPRHLLTVDITREPLPTPEPPQVTVLPFKNETLSIEKRRFARTIVRTHIIVTNRSTQYACQGTTADVSPGGCYVELPSPMSIGTEVEVSGGDRSPFRALGKVVTCHPMFGMGIAFDEQHPDIEQQLSSVISNQAAQPTATPSQETCQPAPCSQPERLLSELMMWFAANPDLTRTKFFELVHNCSRDK
jgi:hypothetical protein